MDIDVKLNYFSYVEHISQIITGFMLLAADKKISLEINNCCSMAQYYPHTSMVEAVINGKIVAFDVLDGYNFDAEKAEKYINGIDFYFKRSFSKEKNDELFSKSAVNKLFPLGFNYHVTTPNNPLDKKVSLYNRIKKLAGYKTPEYFTPDKFEVMPKHNKKSLKILFSCRLWEFNSNDDNFERSVEKINRTRIDIASKLKLEYPNNFYGGIAASPLSKKLCPELIVPKRFTVRSKYLELMKDCDICIATTGLHNSTGWKTGEYIAASRAVVSETLQYEVPGNFEAGKNYYEFSNAYECMAQVRKLAKNHELIYNMKINNYKYYNRFLKPDVLVMNAINTVLL